jgi:hypothetical protein
MKYEVQTTELAQSMIDEAYAWLALETPLNAPIWHKGLLKAIASLELYPLRCPLVPEDEDDSGNVRHLLYGNKRHSYRIIFVVQDRTVSILQFLRAARRARR